jgi:hypothetical protein
MQLGRSLLLTLPRATPRDGWRIKMPRGSTLVVGSVFDSRSIIRTQEERERAFDQRIEGSLYAEFYRVWRDAVVAS